MASLWAGIVHHDEAIAGHFIGVAAPFLGSDEQGLNALLPIKNQRTPGLGAAVPAKERAVLVWQFQFSQKSSEPIGNSRSMLSSSARISDGSQTNLRWKEGRAKPPLEASSTKSVKKRLV